jgi:hypothetical protein
VLVELRREQLLGVVKSFDVPDGPGDGPNDCGTLDPQVALHRMASRQIATVDKNTCLLNSGLSELRRLILFDLQATARGVFGTRRKRNGTCPVSALERSRWRGGRFAC